MRRAWSSLGTALVAVIMVLSVLTTVGLAYGAHAGNAPRIISAAETMHHAARTTGQSPTPSAVVVTPIISNAPLPASTMAPFTIAFAVQITGVASGIVLNASNTTVWIKSFNATLGTVMNFSIPGANLTFVAPNSFSAYWVASGTQVINYQVIDNLGYDPSASPSPTSRFAGKSFTFQVFANAQSVTGMSALSTAVMFPAVTSSIANAQIPAASTVPFNIHYNVTIAGTTISPSTVSVAISTYFGGRPVELAGSVSGQITSGAAQVASITYGFLTTANFGNGTLPAGAYNFTIWISATNSWAASAPSFTNIAGTTTLTTVNIVVTQTTVLAVYQAFPFWINWTIVLSGGGGVTISPTSTNITLAVTDLNSHPRGAAVLTLYPTVVSGQASYAVQFTPTSITAQNYSGSGTWNGVQHFANLPSHTYKFAVIVAVTAASAGSRTTTTVQNSNPSILAPTGNVTAAQITYGSVPQGIGNVSITSRYVGTYLTSALLSVITSTGATAFSQGVFVPTSGPQTVTTTWVPTSTGNFTVSLTLTSSANQTFTATKTVAVASNGGGNLVVNHWYNQSLLGNLGPGVTGALLLVIGLIIGLIIALVLGRLMWGGPRQAPAQPWQQTTTTTTHECSVCHQSFATEAELKEHSKTAHGM